jgi:ribosomal protein L6P/L9E
MNIPKEIICYSFKQNNFIFLLVLSNLQGWGILKFFIRGSFFNKFFSYYYNIINQANFSNFILGFYKNYICFLKLKGMGFKSVIVTKKLMFKLGYSHRIIYVFKKDLLLSYMQKYLFRISTRALNLIKNVIYTYKKIKLPSAYKIKGFFIKGSRFSLKISSKKSKF